MPPIAYRGFAIAPITLRPLPTILFHPPHLSPKTSLLEGGGPPAGGGRSSSPVPGGKVSFLNPTGFTRRSSPPALPPIAYRGFAVAPITLRPSQRNLTVPPSPAPLPKDLPPRGRGTARRRWKEFPRIAPPYHPSRALLKPLIQPRVQGRNPARFNGGYGVPRGFKGEKSKSPPNPLGLAERVPRPQAVEGVPRPSPVEKFPFSTPPGSPVGQALRPCRRLHIGALRSPLSPFAPLKET